MPTGAEFLIVAAVLALMAAPALVVLAVVRRTGKKAPPPVAAAGPAWYVDPTQRHELRWFDGTAWTANVSDRGITSVDELP